MLLNSHISTTRHKEEFFIRWTIADYSPLPKIDHYTAISHIPIVCVWIFSTRQEMFDYSPPLHSIPASIGLNDISYTDLFARQIFVILIKLSQRPRRGL